MKDNKVIIAAIHGFYFYGEQVEAPEGFARLIDASMFGGFSGGKGLAGVFRGDPKSSVTLDRFGEDKEILIPLTSVVFISSGCEDLYKFKNTKLR